jgi:hypothetical protein
MSEDDGDWTGTERARLQALARAEEPPSELEARVVRALRERGLIRGRRRQAWRVPAAAVVAFVCGVALGRAGLEGRGGRGAAPGRSFALLLLPGAGMEGGAAAESARVEEYRAWARGLAAKGQLVDGEKLKAQVKVLAPPSLPVPDGRADGGMLGFFLVRAATAEEAEAIARGCPHLRHGGTISLREIDPT